MISRAGIACAVATKLFEPTHKSQKDDKTIDQALYDKAKDFYLEALYRVIYIGAENSIGFHNPSESSRICTDAMAMANKSESLLRQALAKTGVDVPANIIKPSRIEYMLEMAKYINKRGVKKLKFRPKLEFKDLYGIHIYSYHPF
jgi:nitrite reductase (cytochrome c-552)